MASVHDLADYILRARGPMTAMKLQKLVYYCQAWSMAWDDKPIFRASIEAWSNGPVARELYRFHRREYRLGRRWAEGDASGIEGEAKKTVDAVLARYAKLDPFNLSQLTHQEPPWIQARAGLPPTARSARVISLESMRAYYSQFV